MVERHLEITKMVVIATGFITWRCGVLLFHSWNAGRCLDGEKKNVKLENTFIWPWNCAERILSVLQSLLSNTDCIHSRHALVADHELEPPQSCRHGFSAVLITTDQWLIIHWSMMSDPWLAISWEIAPQEIDSSWSCQSLWVGEVVRCACAWLVAIRSSWLSHWVKIPSWVTTQRATVARGLAIIWGLLCWTTLLGGQAMSGGLAPPDVLINPWAKQPLHVTINIQLPHIAHRTLIRIHYCGPLSYGSSA